MFIFYVFITEIYLTNIWRDNWRSVFELLMCVLFFRIQAVFAHVQTFFNLPSLDVPIEFTVMAIEHLDQGYEARGSYLKYVILVKSYFF